jgi:hypothetical protein
MEARVPRRDGERAGGAERRGRTEGSALARAASFPSSSFLSPPPPSSSFLLLLLLLVLLAVTGGTRSAAAAALGQQLPATRRQRCRTDDAQQQAALGVRTTSSAHARGRSSMPVHPLDGPRRQRRPARGATCFSSFSRPSLLRWPSKCGGEQHATGPRVIRWPSSSWRSAGQVRGAAVAPWQPAKSLGARAPAPAGQHRATLRTRLRQHSSHATTPPGACWACPPPVGVWTSSADRSVEPVRQRRTRRGRVKGTPYVHA